MTRYTSRVPLPDGVKDTLERITEVAYVVSIDYPAGEAIVEWESNDLYELAERVHELENVLQSSGYYSSLPILERPVPEVKRDSR